MRESIALVGFGGSAGLIAGILTQHDYFVQSVIIGLAGVILAAAIVWKRVSRRV